MDSNVCVNLKGFTVCWPKDASVKINKKDVNKVDLDKFKAEEPICKVKFEKFGVDGSAEVFESLGIYPENLKENPPSQVGLFLPENLFQAKRGDILRVSVEGDDAGKYEYICTITDAKGINIEITGKKAQVNFSETGNYRVKIEIRDKKSGKELKFLERTINVIRKEKSRSDWYYPSLPYTPPGWHDPCRCGDWGNWNWSIYPYYDVKRGIRF